METADDISFFGYPLVADSTAPTFTTGVVAGPIQDDRLDEFRAVINTTADISGGNSGGPAIDDSGDVVGVATWESFDDGGGAFSRIRPINLAEPVIDAAIAGKKYVSPWSKPGSSDAEITTWDYGVPDVPGAITSGCPPAGPGANPTTLVVGYKGFPGGAHTDLAAGLYEVAANGEATRVAYTATSYPTKLDKKGCLTLTFPTDVSPGTYWLKIGIGGDLKLIVSDDTFTIE